MNRFPDYWRPWVGLVTFLGGLGVFLAFHFLQEHERIEDAERERLTTQTKVIEVNLTRQLVAINLALESLIAELPDWASRSDGKNAAIRRLQSMEASMPSVRTFLVLDAQGTVTLSSRQELLGKNFYQREYFQVHQQSKNRNMLHVSAPFKSVLNVYVVNLTRAIVGPQGEFAGVVSATVDPIEMQALLNSVRYADDMRAILIHGDGKVFVSQPDQPDFVGKDLSGPASFFSQHLSKQSQVSPFQDIAQLGGADERMLVLRSVQPPALAMDKPLVTSLSRDWAALFAPWQREARNQLLTYVLAVLLSSAGLSLYLQQRARQRRMTQRLKLATEATGIGIWEFDLKSRRYYWDATMFELSGIDPQTVNERNDDWHTLVLPDELQRIKSATRMAIEQHQPLALTFQFRRPDGQVRFIRNRAALHEDSGNVPTRLVGTSEDVTERMIWEADLRIAATAFESNESMLVTDAHAVILRVNHAFTDHSGYSAQEAIGQTPRLFQSGRHDLAFYATLWADLQRDGAWQGEIWNRRKSGEVFPVWLSITAVCNEEGEVTHYVASHTDITLRMAAEAEIKSLAFTDPLTNLPNRRLLQDRLHQALIQAKRNNCRLALIFLDLDKFKPVNDAFGHQAGDELLLAVAQRLLACMRESDTVARVGGDEFVVLLPGLEAAHDALGVAEKIHATLQQPFTLAQGQTVHISSSSGIALYPEHGRDEITLMSHADAAMYQAKSSGRDKFVLFSPEAQTSIGPTQ